MCVFVCGLTRWFSVPMASRLRFSLSCMSRILARLRATRPCASKLQQKKSSSTPPQQVRSIFFKNAALKRSWALPPPAPPAPSVESGPSKVGAHHLHYNHLHYNLLLNSKTGKQMGSRNHWIMHESTYKIKKKNTQKHNDRKRSQGTLRVQETI